MAPSSNEPILVRLFVVGDDAPFHYHTVDGFTFQRTSFAHDGAVKDELGHPQKRHSQGSPLRLVTPAEIRHMREVLKSRYLVPRGTRKAVMVAGPRGLPRDVEPVSKYLAIRADGSTENLLETFDAKPAASPATAAK